VLVFREIENEIFLDYKLTVLPACGRRVLWVRRAWRVTGLDGAGGVDSGSPSSGDDESESLALRWRGLAERPVVADVLDGELEDTCGRLG
jgi:hypothetical protein